MLIQKEVALINRARTLVRIKVETDLPEWAKDMEKIGVGDTVSDDVVTGKVELFGWDDRGTAIAVISVGESRHRVSLITLKKL